MPLKFLKSLKKFKLPKSLQIRLPEKFKLAMTARKVVLLPDAHFFCRAVPIDENATAAEAAVQVELALEALSPFPPTQMYHGHFWRPGARNACVFAAYRKRFTSEQVESWADAEAVIPTFAAMLGAPIRRPTTLLLWSAKGLSAINWNDVNDAPVSVISRELPPEPTDQDKAALREAVLIESGSSRTVVAPAGAPALDETAEGDGFNFRCEHLNAAFTREQLDMLDVRDKEELAARRRARIRDTLLWRSLLGCFAAIALSLSLEFILIGGHLWQKARVAKVVRQSPVVEKILMAKNLSVRIDELSTKRMRPFEMITMVAEKKPNSVTFVSAAVKNMLTLSVEAQVATSTDLDAFRSALNSVPNFERVDILNSRLQNGITTFTLEVTFRPDAFNPTP